MRQNEKGGGGIHTGKNERQKEKRESVCAGSCVKERETDREGKRENH